MSRRAGLIGLGAALVAAGAGTAIGLAAERWTVNHSTTPDHSGELLGSLRGPSRQVCASDGTMLYVEVDDVPDAPSGASGAPPITVVFSHGYCLNLDAWHYQRQALRGRYRLVLWDQRGHGRSQAGPVGSCTVDQCGHDLLDVLQDVVPDGPVVLVGHSMGGMTIMALAAEYPDIVRERVVGVALVATSSGGLSDVTWGLRGGLSRLAHRIAPLALSGLARAPRLVDRTLQIGSDLHQVVVQRYSYASPVPESLVRFTGEMIAGTSIEVIADYLPTFDLHDKREALSALDGIETLVLSGSDDLLTPPEHSEEIVRRLPGAEHVVVPNAGHLVMLEHPAEVTAHLVDLLALAERSVRERWAQTRPRRGRRRRGRR